MTPTTDLTEMTTIVVGASRGLGRGITTAFAEAGAPVIAVARSTAPLADQSAGGGIQPEIADAGDPTVAGSLLDRYEPTAVIVVAGASPLLRPLQDHTWETFSVNWHTAFGSHSSGCARRCSSRYDLAAG
jgi:NAD(P)-dependent dehydrogenase (short-subunit alcohol dehydrogenase family)